MSALITPEMRTQATVEAKRRDAHIRHHFEVAHLSGGERDELGFLGEFACCTLLNIDWRRNIRDNYLTIDNYDFIVKGLKADVKTETIPRSNALKIQDRSIKDNNSSDFGNPGAWSQISQALHLPHWVM